MCDGVGSLSIKYTYTFDDGQVEHHVVDLDPGTLELQEATPDTPPRWTQLDNNQCPNCPLTPQDHPYCPAALAVATVATQLGRRISYTQVKVRVETSDRTVMKQTSLQEGLFPLLGLKMATSGCPVLSKLRPMARFHLPFADSDETVYRAISMYLVGQFLRRSKGLPARFDLQELSQIYEAIHQVNLAFSKRLDEASNADANINSLTTLDMFAQEVPLTVETALTHLDEVFSPYME